MSRLRLYVVIRVGMLNVGERDTSIALGEVSMIGKDECVV